jgi:hypothetical protein
MSFCSNIPSRILKSLMFMLFPPLSRLFVFVVADLQMASFWCHPDRSTSAFCWCGVQGSWLILA